jgi:hypothetical protein
MNAAIRAFQTLMIALGAIALFTAIVMMMNVGDGSIPQCTSEDGSSQSICEWHYTVNGEPRTLINHEYGEWTYYPHTDTTITWDNEPNPLVVQNAARG